MSEAKPLFELAPKQNQFMAASSDEILFGGAAGGGKTMALVIKALGLNNIGISNGQYRALIIRKSYEDIETVLAYQRKYYPYTSNPAPEWKRQEKHWEWANGAKVEFGYLQSEADLQRYVGNQYDFVAVEELADTIPNVEWWNILVSRVRSGITGLSPMAVATTNPRGKGVPWIMSRWAIAPDGKSTKQRIWQDPIKIGDELIDGRWRTLEYIQSLPTDNVYWDAAQRQSYVQSLANMPDDIRTALLLGRWDAISGDDLLIHPLKVRAAADVVLTKDRKTYGRRIIGVDPAHQGKDSTVIIHRKLDTLYNLSRHHGLNAMQLAAKLMKAVETATQEDGEAPIVNIDYAMGAGVADRMRELGFSCNTVHFASKPYDPVKYLNKRAEMYGELAEAINTAIEYRIPNDASLIQQLGAVMIDRDSSGRLKLAPKDQIKKEVGRSPDEADAAALTYAVHVSPVKQGAGWSGAYQSFA